MAIIRKRDLSGSTEAELMKKLEELKLESMKATKPSQGTSIKTREIKKTIARILTYLKQKQNGNMS